MSVFKSLVPEPLLSVTLLVIWLFLARSTSAGQILIGLVLAVVVPILTSSLRPVKLHARRPRVVARFLVTVGFDVLASNVEVGRGVVFGRWKPTTPCFVVVPLELRDPLGLAVLAMVVTVIPGTVWSELALDRSALLLHVWDAPDEQRFIARFKERYEQPLKEIFE